MDWSPFFRLLPVSCAFITFLQSFIVVLSLTETLNNLEEHHRPKRYVSSQSFANQTFIPNAQKFPEYGPWGPWTEMSQCSRTCGGGVAHQDRICMDMKADGRHSCVGLARRYFSCNIQECPPGSKDFRSEQCNRFNSLPYSGRYYSWLPYYQASSPCELYCVPHGGSFYQKMDTKVIDGTKCRDDGSRDICVDGQCMPVGCDNILGSTTQEDECRVCGGDGSTCSIVKGVFDEDNFAVGYNDILLIPVGATSILIQKMQPTKNFLAVRNADGKFYLNGNWKIEFPRELRFAGTVFHYERKPQGNLAPETLRAKGPTTEAIFIVLLYQERNLGVNYEYSVPVTTKTPAPDSYVWTTGDFEDCSQTCGGGVQYRSVRCIQESNRDIIDERLCDPVAKPEEKVVCNNEPCPSKWKIGEWSNCTKPCGGGTQFRVVYCYQEKDSNTVLSPDENCEQPKPLFMRSCNVDKECPKWITGDWSECDSDCGIGSQNRTVECFSSELDEVVKDDHCISDKKPDDTQSCELAPCEGVEWIVSDWSKCDGSCSPRMASREVHCANEKGVVFPDEACEASKMPELTKPCPKSELCDPMWHTSQWTDCSVNCGKGIQIRVVFCGTWQDESVIKIEDKMCDPEKKFEEVQECSADSCQGVWFTGPWNMCSVPCGGGERSRAILCFHENKVVDSGECDPNEEPYDKEECNVAPCDDDEMMAVGGCKDSKYGCCPDGTTKAGYNYEGCAKVNVTSTNVSCEEAEFGCCSDGFTLALGPYKKGCPITVNCNSTKYGCCADGKTAAKGPDMEGCSEETECSNSTFGCCLDNVTVALGPNEEGCPEEIECSNSTYGCCPDNVTAALGPDEEGCSEEIECSNSTYGCCPDNVTVALGDNEEGCPEEIECYNSTYGCCPDNVTAALGANEEGCPEEIECSNSTYGCCPDNVTAAVGPNEEGCLGESDCTNTTYGCCPDGMTAASGPNLEDCEATTVPFRPPLDIDESSGEDCYSQTFGCCPDGLTSAIGPNQEGCNDTANNTDCSRSAFGCCDDGFTQALGPMKNGCPEFESSGDGELLTDCEETFFGCCPDNTTVAKGYNGEGCIDCINSTYGCCSDNVTFAPGPDQEGCDQAMCSASKYGCCPDNSTIAIGRNYKGCECLNTTFGCCFDNVTVALGPNEEGCEIDMCTLAEFGCCPDNATLAFGPDFEGCECLNSTYGCCSDNITFALGPDEEGCPVDCSSSTYGCCDDNVTLATGPDMEGCGPVDCSNSTYGCCDDNTTFATGPDMEGCGPVDCSNTSFGCCPDNATIALGPDLEGCGSDDCSNTSFGCCPDNVTSASGPDGEGCVQEDCQNSTYGCCDDNVTIALGPDGEGCTRLSCSDYVFGCCPDNKTAAVGPDGEGCATDCSNTTYGCCPDNVTAALGSDYEGCNETVACQDSEFGCCPDNATPASGPEYEGCVETIPETTTEEVPSCVDTEFGCCPDKITVALGNNFEGCCFGMPFGCCPDNKTVSLGPKYIGCSCFTFPFGCCPDNKTPAKGPNFYGCTCEHTRYGCCPDGVTAAVGPEYQGCSCESTPFGCCPNGLTAARSPDLRDCPCETQRYGCCLDGRTTAQGPEYEGCPCDQTRFGCCPDGRTTARGPRYEGCACQTMPYGCCADGYTPAAGPRLEGCPDVSQPEPKVSTEVCSLPKESGPCRNFTVKWFFDVAYGGCSRFWYGGCDGNGNNFATQEDCEKICVKPDGPEACLLPMVAGSCDGKVPSWYFDAGSKTCEPFTYGGCLGNNNRFVSKTECEAKCIDNQPVKPMDKCSLPKDEGACDSAIIKWYYNTQAARCEQFYYGGCKGNTNRFESRRECEKSCMASVIKETDVCRLPHDIGPCNDFRERWYFEYETAECRRFIFGGCDGNANNFASFSECEKQCGSEDTTAPEQPTEQEFVTEFCFQEQDPGPCGSPEVHWFYDSNDGVCKEFYYGGCKGNRNRFKTRKECETSCFKAQDTCSLAAVKGPCSGTFTQWYYDKDQDECLEFTFGGCQGNANRFNSKDSCYQQCKKEQVTTEPTVVISDICSLPQDPGPCLGYYQMYYYDSTNNTCKSFIYGGCEGNENRFRKRRQCEQRCVRKLTKEPGVSVTETSKVANEDVCRLPVESGPCTEVHPRWFYDAQTQNCLPFVYGGCSGNKNRFKTAEICLKFCSGVKAKTSRDEVTYLTVAATTTTPAPPPPPPTACPPSNCFDIQCPYGIEESFDNNGCSTCRCSNPCEVHSCPEGSRCAIDVVRTSREGVRTEPVCRRIQKPGICPSTFVSSGPRDCETRCRDDADCRGEYKCCNNGCAFICVGPADETPPVATRPEPATILPGVNVTHGRIGAPAELPCNAMGNPRPSVTWWRETTMLPLSSRRYEQLPNYALLIRSVVYEDGGDYSCHAHNGVGSGATYKVTLIIDLGYETGTEDSRDSEPEIPHFGPVTPQWNDVPLSARVNLVTSDPIAGTPVQVDCITEGPPETTVFWEYESTELSADDRRRILSNNTLFITKADTTDSGEYKCTAKNGNSIATSSIYISVRAMVTESSCIDNPQFNNCNLIVKANYCNNKYYGKFCCASCMQAGQIREVPPA